MVLLKESDLKPGMLVSEQQLKDILDTIIVIKDYFREKGELKGKYVYHTKEPNEISNNYLIRGGYRCIYNDSEDLDDDISYDE